MQAHLCSCVRIRLFLSCLEQSKHVCSGMKAAGPHQPASALDLSDFLLT
jgi:hypothetical protein